ncbi:hypothetical protein JCM10908_003816 [Rhodotorula pacifica]|uniref:uncharacterized protein n=1 Tax=Rhodotorula pacifica TaxID=1495444 RepID=UPI0031727B55
MSTSPPDAPTAASDKAADTVTNDNKSQEGDAGQAEPRRVTINDLPPEIVLAIVEQVDLVCAEERLRPAAGHNAGAAGGAGANANGAANNGAAAAGLQAGELLADFMNQMLGGGAGGGLPRAGGAAAAPAPVPPAVPATNNNAAGVANRGDEDEDEMPPLEPIPTGRAAAATPARPAQTQQDDDDDMPPLEPINGPPASAAARPAAASAPAAAAASSSSSTSNTRSASSFLSAFSNPLAAFAGLTGANRNSNNTASTPAVAPTPASIAPAAAARTAGGDDDDDDMPPLEPINPPAGRAPTSANSSSRPAATLARTATNTTAAADDDDDMPPLEPIDGPARSSTSSGPARPAAANATRAAAEDSDDDMPPLEAINPSASSSNTGTGSSSRKTAKKSGEETEDDMPEMEPIDSKRVADRSRLPSTASTSAAAAASTSNAAAAADDDDELPPLEPIDDGPSSSRAPAPATAQPAANATRGDEDEGMPPLEPIDDAPSAPATATAPAPIPVRESAAGNGSDDPDGGDDDDDGDEDDDDDDDDDWESENEHDAEDEDDSDDEDRIFSDGLPLDPVVPLALVNRPFLHAARKVLYRHVAVPSPYVAVLVRETLSRSDPAGFIEGDKVLLPTKEYDGGKTKITRNVLCNMVRSLTFSFEGDCTLGRGGGRVYIDLIRMCTDNLEMLTLRPLFMASATKPLLEALAELKRLKEVDLYSSTEPKKPFIVTTARIYKLMQQSWRDLEKLIITDLKPAEEGPGEEYDEMWEIADDFADAEYDRQQIERKEGDKEEEGDMEDKDAGDKSTDSVVARRPRGLKDLQLYGFNVTGTELELILQDSKQTLRTLALHRPSYLFKRTDLASTLLTFGHNLTMLDLLLPDTWDPVPKLLPGQSRPPFPVRPKDHKVGEPSDEYKTKVGRYTYLLDAVMPCLPNLTRLRFDGPHASAHVFAWFPEKLKTVSFSNCPTISPSTLVKVLNKTLTRTKQVTKKDGSIGTKSFQTKAARGMTCLTVTNDDLNWSDSEISALQNTLDERDCCLHLTSDAVHGGYFPIFGGLGLGGLFGGGGIGRGGNPLAQPAPRRNPAAL